MDLVQRLNWWQQTLIGLAFGIVLLVLFLLPNDLGGYLTIAAVLMVVVATISGFVLARFALDRAWRPADVRRVRKFVVRSAFGLALAIGLLAFLSRSQWVLWLWTAFGLALAIGLLAFLSRSQWVLWLWTVPGCLAWFAWMVLALERSMTRFDPPQP